MGLVSFFLLLDVLALFAILAGGGGGSNGFCEK